MQVEIPMKPAPSKFCIDHRRKCIPCSKPCAVFLVLYWFLQNFPCHIDSDNGRVR